MNEHIKFLNSLTTEQKLYFISYREEILKTIPKYFYANSLFETLKINEEIIKICFGEK